MKEKITSKILAIRSIHGHHSSKFLTQLVKDMLLDYGIQKNHVLCFGTIKCVHMMSMVKQLNEQPGEGSNTAEESAAEIQEQSAASLSNQLILCDDYNWFL